MFDYEGRRRQLSERMRAHGLGLLFLAPSADLEYLTGVERQIPSFGQSSYAHGWVAGAFFRPDSDPVFVLPRMMVAFELEREPDGEVVVVNETDDGVAAFERVARGLGHVGTVGVGDRVWAETMLRLASIFGTDRLRTTASAIVNSMRRIKCEDELAAMGRAIGCVEEAMAAATPLVVPGVTMGDLLEAVEHELRVAGSRTPSFTTHIFTGFGDGELDSGTTTKREPLREGTAVMFDFGAVVDGYCSDFGRTIYCGEPPRDYRDAYEVMVAAHDAGQQAAAAGISAAEVNAACRAPIEAAGLGEHFRHRMGHGIGLDVHERPFISTEDDTPLEPGMTFTDEPSIIIKGRFGVRIENILVCEESRGRNLNSYPTALVANG